MQKTSDTLHMFKYDLIGVFLKQLPTQANASAEAVGKSRSYLKLLLNQDVMMYAHVETDVISILAKLSVFMQREKCIVSDIMMKVHTTVEVLRKYKTWYGQLKLIVVKPSMNCCICL